MMGHANGPMTVVMGYTLLVDMTPYHQTAFPSTAANPSLTATETILPPMKMKMCTLPMSMDAIAPRAQRYRPHIGAIVCLYVN